MVLAADVKNVSKKYGSQDALRDLSFSVNSGEIFGLVGPDGAGKTTTLRILSTAISPTSGTASVFDFDVVSREEQVKDYIGYMPQVFALYEDLTLEENIDFYADLYLVDGSLLKEKKEDLLKSLGLERFRKRQAGKLSGGMKKKLALACTLIHSPRLLILDEPTTGVDPLSRREFWRMLYSLVPEVTIVISTPYMDEAERCNRVGLIYNGALKLVDEPTKILDKISGEILELKCQDIRGAKKLLIEKTGIKNAEIFGDSIHVLLDSYEQDSPRVKEVLDSGGVKDYSLRKIPPKLEDVFVSILK